MAKVWDVVISVVCYGAPVAVVVAALAGRNDILWATIGAFAVVAFAGNFYPRRACQ